MAKDEEVEWRRMRRFDKKVNDENKVERKVIKIKVNMR